MLIGCSLLLLLVRPGYIRYCDEGNTPMGSSESASLYKVQFFLRPELFLLGDVAYRSDDRVKTGYRQPELDIDDPIEAARRREYNVRLSSERIRVEHTFSRIKHTWRLLQSTWNMRLGRLPPTFRACCLLSNWLLRSRRLYM
jgi:hypothetical protein